MAFMWTAIAYAADAPLLPNEPIGDVTSDSYDHPACKSYDFLEGATWCWELSRLGEPPYPVTDKETKLAIRMIWRIGDRGSILVLRYEIQDGDRAFVAVHEATTGGLFPYTEGHAFITPAEISALLAAEKQSDFWVQPETRPEPKPSKKSKGIETVTLCYSGLTLSEVLPGRHKTVSRDCPYDKVDAGLRSFAQALIHVARNHFPDVAASDLWSDERK